MTTQDKVVKAMRDTQEKQGYELSEIYMFRPFGHHEKVPTWICTYKNGKEKVYSINAAGYDVYMKHP